MKKPTVKFEIEIIESSDSSVKAIYAIRQVMERMSLKESLSADGKDFRAVYAWFVERYRPGVLIK